MLNNKEKVKELLLYVRKTYNLTQEDLAESLFVTDRTIRNWEKGISLPSIEDIIMICSKYDISFDDYFLNHNESASVLSSKLNTGSNNYDIVSTLIKWIFYLVLLYVFSSLISFLCYVSGRLSNHFAIISFFIVIIFVSIIIFKNKKNKPFLLFILTGLIVYFACYLILYVSMYDLPSYFFKNVYYSIIFGIIPSFISSLPIEASHAFALTVLILSAWMSVCLYCYFKTLNKKPLIRFSTSFAVFFTIVSLSIIAVSNKASQEYITDVRLEFIHPAISKNDSYFTYDDKTQVIRLYKFIKSLKTLSIPEGVLHPDDIDGNGRCCITFFSGNQMIDEYIFTYNDFKYIVGGDDTKWRFLNDKDIYHLETLLNKIISLP